MKLLWSSRHHTIRYGVQFRCLLGMINKMKLRTHMLVISTRMWALSWPKKAPARSIDILNQTLASNEVIPSTHTSLKVALQEKDYHLEAMTGIKKWTVRQSIYFKTRRLKNKPSWLDKASTNSAIAEKPQKILNPDALLLQVFCLQRGMSIGESCLKPNRSANSEYTNSTTYFPRVPLWNSVHL